MITLRHTAMLLSILLLASPVAAQRVRQVSDFEVTYLGAYAVDDAGGVVFFTSTTDQFGTNPDYHWQIFKRILPAGSPVQVTSFNADTTTVSVSDDGATILFLSDADPLDANTDGSTEVFLANSSGGSMV